MTYDHGPGLLQLSDELLGLVIEELDSTGDRAALYATCRHLRRPACRDLLFRRAVVGWSLPKLDLVGWAGALRSLVLDHAPEDDGSLFEAAEKEAPRLRVLAVQFSGPPLDAPLLSMARLAPRLASLAVTVAGYPSSRHRVAADALAARCRGCVRLTLGVPVSSAGLRALAAGAPLPLERLRLAGPQASEEESALAALLAAAPRLVSLSLADASGSVQPAHPWIRLLPPASPPALAHASLFALSSAAVAGLLAAYGPSLTDLHLNPHAAWRPPRCTLPRRFLGARSATDPALNGDDVVVSLCEAAPRLRSLVLQAPGAGRGALGRLAGRLGPSLRFACLEGPELDDAFAAALAASCPSLTALSLRRCRLLTAAGLAALAPLPHLQELALHGYTDFCAAALPAFAALRRAVFVATIFADREPGLYLALARAAPRLEAIAVDGASLRVLLALPAAAPLAPLLAEFGGPAFPRSCPACFAAAVAVEAEDAACDAALELAGPP